MKHLAAVLLGLAPAVNAISSGLVSSCEAKAPYGCPLIDGKQWTNNDRKRCIKTGIPMDWAAAPVHSSNFTLRAGDGDPALDRTTYSPGVPMSIDLRVHHPEMKWRGIIMHAVNHEGVTVGEWKFIQDDVPLFQTPPMCPGTLLHTHAEYKPFHIGRAHYSWIPPPAGTGTVTFHTLIKQGPANIGEFYYPETDLVLYEQFNEGFIAPNSNATTGMPISHVSTTSSESWYVAAYGQNCDELCESMDKECDMDAMMVPSSQDFVDQIESTYQCSAVAIKDCSFASPAVTSDGQCYFHSSFCTPEEKKFSNGASVEEDATVCSAATAGLTSKHFCVCSSALRRLLASPITSLLSALTALHLALGARPSSGSSSTIIMLVATLVAISTLAPPANAHNWAMSRTRSTQIARGGRVCDSRKSGEVHAQVGPGQPFTFQWASGHSRPSYIVVMKGDEEHIQTNSSYLKMIEAYITEAPPSANLMPTHSKHNRMHLSRGSLLDAATNSEGQTNPYFDEVPLNDARWQQVHPDTSSGFTVLTTYNQETIDGDRHVSYANPKYPWFEAVHKYDHVYSRGGDLDLARVEIPGRNCAAGSKSCHYVMHWYWSGYNDCVDVDFFPDQQVAEVYGVPSADGVQYTQVDHCQYIKPQRGLSQCHVIEDGDATKCMEELHTHQYYKNAFRGVPLSSETWRFGVNVVPAVAPKQVPLDLRQTEIVPWNKGWCAGEATILNGVLSRKNHDWSTWQTNQADHLPGMDCSEPLWEVNQTFAQAVEWCSVDFRKDCSKLSSGTLRNACRDNRDYQSQVCAGISYPTVGSGADLAAVYLFKGCKHTGVGTDYVSTGGRQVWSKKIVPAMSSASGTSAWTKISFQKKDSPIVRFDGASAAEFAVEGLDAPFGLRDKGLTYGFNCLDNGPGTAGLYARDGVDYNPAVDANQVKITTHFLDWVRSVDSTWVDFRSNSLCKNLTLGERLWEIEVPNGIYEVKTNHERGDNRMRQFSNFVIENVRVPVTDFSGSGSKFPAIVGHREIILSAVEVTDGRLTVVVNNRVPSNHGTTINTLEFRRVGDVGTMTPAWLPTAVNPEMLVTLPQPEPVGLVKITLPGTSVDLPCRKTVSTSCSRYEPEMVNHFDCRANWFLGGNKCGYGGSHVKKDVAFPGGNFDADTEGAVVTVSNDYKFVYRKEEECARITLAPVCLSRLLEKNNDYNVDQNVDLLDPVIRTICDIEVNCKGKVGKYVHIVLPGQDRILAIENVEVHRMEPIIAPGSNAKICYGLEARRSGALPFPVQEFETTDDPEDPIFFSTCFVRTEVINWLSTVAVPSTAPDPFVFNGKCLDCASYTASLAEANFTTLDAPNWMLDEQCQDCHVVTQVNNVQSSALAAVSSSIGPIMTVSAENPDGIRGGMPVGVVLVIVLLLAAAATAAVVLYKKNKSGNANMSAGTSV